MKKFAVIVLFIIAGSCVSANGDKIFLKNANKEVDIQVVGATEESINAVILKKNLKSLNIHFSDARHYPDVISLKNIDADIECKVREITEEKINVLIPTSVISSMQISFPSGDGKQSLSGVVEGVDKPKTAAAVIPEGEKTQTERVEERPLKPAIREDTGKGEMSDEIKTDLAGGTGGVKRYRLKNKMAKEGNKAAAEVLSGVAKEEAESADIGEPVVGEEPQKESGVAPKLDEGVSGDIQGEIINDSHGGEVVMPGKGDLKEEKTIVQDPAMGSVEGKILRSGNPLPDCQVRLQMLEKAGLISKGYRPVEGAVEIETVTDKDGRYQFMNVSPGGYKLYWKPPSETSWVRRFKMEPDVIVEAGRVVNPKDIETLKRTLN